MRNVCHGTKMCQQMCSIAHRMVNVTCEKYKEKVFIKDAKESLRMFL